MYKILVVGPTWVGDMMMAQALFKALKHQHPVSKISVLAQDWSRPLLSRMPEVDEAIAQPLKHGQLGLRARYQLAQSLKVEKFDQAVVLPNSFKSALIPFWAKIPRRTGWRGEMRYGLLNDLRVLDKKELPKMVQRYVALAYPAKVPLPNPLPEPSLKIEKYAVNATLTKLSLTLPEKPLLVLCPGAEFGPSKKWPERYYAEVARAKLNEGWQVWILGSKNDEKTAQEIQKQTRGLCINLSGLTNLNEAIDLLSLATLVLCNDSGLMHIAAALSKPLVAIYGSTDPNYTPPLGEASQIVRLGLSCSPCFKRTCPLKHHHCMEQLLPELVLDAADKMLTVKRSR